MAYGSRVSARLLCRFTQREAVAMKAVLYCRMSTSSSFSLDMIRGQQLRLLNYAKENGIEVAGVYSDVGYPGSALIIPAHWLSCRPSGRARRTSSL